MSGFVEYAAYDGVGLAALVRKGEVQPKELVEAAIERIETLNPALNAVVHAMYDRALAMASGQLPDGPFRGVPFLLKDLLAAYAGEPLTSGSRFLKEFIPDHHSELVRRYLAAGLIPLGKTNTPEFGLTPYTEPELFGPTHNPWDLGRTVGGSSGGSGAAVAARLVPMASGGDGGGSIRIPASCCGVFGLKPSRGRTPSGPDVIEFWHGMTVQHALTRSVRDSAALLDATAGPELGARMHAPRQQRPYLEEVAEDPGRLRIAFTDKPLLGRQVHPDCQRGLHETVTLLSELGHQLEEASPPLDRVEVARAFLTILCAEFRLDIQEAERQMGRKASYREFEMPTWVFSLLGDVLSAAELDRALRVMDRTARQMADFLSEFDVLLTPTLAEPPVPTGSLAPSGLRLVVLRALARLNAGKLIHALGALDASAEENFDFVPYTTPFNMTGQPAMSVPLIWNEQGLPIGMQFVARYGDEATLFRLAGQLERARPWADRMPAVGA